MYTFCIDVLGYREVAAQAENEPLYLFLKVDVMEWLYRPPPVNPKVEAGNVQDDDVSARGKGGKELVRIRVGVVETEW